MTSDLLYGTIFTNYFEGRRQKPDVQAREILDVIFRGILGDDSARPRVKARTDQGRVTS